MERKSNEESPIMMGIPTVLKMDLNQEEVDGMLYTIANLPTMPTKLQYIRTVLVPFLGMSTFGVALGMWALASGGWQSVVIAGALAYLSILYREVNMVQSKSFLYCLISTQIIKNAMLEKTQKEEQEHAVKEE